MQWLPVRTSSLRILKCVMGCTIRAMEVQSIKCNAVIINWNKKYHLWIFAKNLKKPSRHRCITASESLSQLLSNLWAVEMLKVLCASYSWSFVEVNLWKRGEINRIRNQRDSVDKSYETKPNSSIKVRSTRYVTKVHRVLSYLFRNLFLQTFFYHIIRPVPPQIFYTILKMLIEIWIRKILKLNIVD